MLSASTVGTSSVIVSRSGIAYSAFGVSSAVGTGIGAGFAAGSGSVGVPSAGAPSAVSRFASDLDVARSISRRCFLGSFTGVGAGG
jgi:hypothetical protein